MALSKSVVDPTMSAEDVFLLWATYNQHRIPSRPRNVHWSQELVAANLAADLMAGVQRIEAVAQSGGDLNPFQTDLLENRNRPKKKKKEGAKHRDGMLLDWGITHMHLGPPILNEYFVGRGKELLFVVVRPDDLYLLTVEDHHSFERAEVLEVVHRNWPQIIAGYHAGASVVGFEDAFEQGLSAKDRRKLRKNVVMPVKMSDGTMYFSPGGGVSTMGSGALAIDRSMRELEQIRLIKQHIISHRRQVIEHLKLKLGMRGEIKLVYDYETGKVLEQSAGFVLPWELIGLKTL